MAAPALPKWQPEFTDDAGIEAVPDASGRYASAPPDLPSVAPPAPAADPFADMYQAPRRVSLGTVEQQLQQIEDDELRGSLEAADAALAAEEARAASSPANVMAGQMEGSVGAYGDAIKNFLQYQPRHGQRVNTLRRFPEQRVRERGEQDPAAAEQAYEAQVPFQPEPFLPLPRYEDESEADYAERMQLFADVDYKQQLEAYENKKAEWLTTGARDLATLDTRDIGRAPGAIGMEEAMRQGQENVDAAKMEQDQELAREQAIAAGKQADATMAIVQQQEEQRAREEAGTAAVRQIQDVRNQARERLATMAPVQREQVAKGLSTGTKLAAVFGAIAQGWRGDAITAVNDAIDRGVAEKLDLYERRKSELGDVIDQADDTMAMLDFVTNSVGGNREASAALLREMTIEDAISDIKAKEAATNVPVLQAQYKQMRTALEQQLRDETMQMDLALAKTPEMIGYTIDSPFNRLMREEAKASMKDARAEQRDLRKDFRAEASKDADRASALEVEGAKSRGAVEAKRAEKDAEWEQTVKKQTAAMGGAETAIDDFLKKNTGNIHGRGWVGTGEKDQRIETDSFLTALKLQITQAFTGATATPEQQEAFDRLVDGSWTEISDDDLRSRLRSLKEILASQRKYMQRPIQTADRQITNTRELTTFQPR